MPEKDDAHEGAASAPDDSFDARLGRLEEIVSMLERGELELEPSILKYKEGVALLKDCRELIGSYAKQVEELSRDASASLRPYADDPDLQSGAGRPDSER